SPGDPASWPLDQREERSAKTVFEKPLHLEFVFDVCLDHQSLKRSHDEHSKDRQ
ncbi:hypothetical protein NEOLEDRAFT_1068456, partial [Neolentinus lepideus HHB14362 ss-1]